MPDRFLPDDQAEDTIQHLWFYLLTGLTAIAVLGVPMLWMWDSVAGVNITLVTPGTIQATIWSVVALWSLYVAAVTFDVV
jgi:hypothetical protein